MDRDEMDQFDLSLPRSQRLQPARQERSSSGTGRARTLLIHVEQKEVFRWRNLL